MFKTIFDNFKILTKKNTKINLFFHTKKSFVFSIIIVFFISSIFISLYSCINIPAPGIKIQTQKQEEKKQVVVEKKEPQIQINPFINNPVDDTYKYPDIPSDFLTYGIYRTVLNLNFDYLLKKYQNDKEIENYLSFYEILKEYYNSPESITALNTSKIQKLIQLSNFLENSFKKRNQFFKAKYFNQMNKTFSALKQYILTEKNMNNNIKSQNLTAITNMFYLTGEPLLVPAETIMIEKALKFRKYDIAYFFGGKLYLMQNNMLKSRLYFGLGLKNLTKNENENILTTYYYQTRETIFNYTFEINFTNRSKITNVTFKLFIPNNTEYQNLSNFKISSDGHYINNYSIIKNEINQNILNIHFDSIASGNHKIIIFMNIHTIPYKFSPTQISQYNLDDYDYSNPLIKATLKPSTYFDYNKQKVRNYIINIKNSLPPDLQNNILALSKQAYLFVINKLTYDLNIMNNLNYRITLDKKYGKDALRCLIKPENSVCENYATLLTTILKSLKIPAFYAYGPVYKLPYHAWVKILLPDNRFYILDPTFADPIGQNGDDAPLYFLYNPANRVEESLLDPNYPIIEGNPDSNITVTYAGNPIENFSYRTVLTIKK